MTKNATPLKRETQRNEFLAIFYLPSSLLYLFVSTYKEKTFHHCKQEFSQLKRCNADATVL